MITNTQFQLFDTLFNYYNNKLFGGKLNDCMIITSRKNGAKGYFVSKNWKDKTTENNAGIHEISLNPDYLGRADIQWQSTLVHEMVHLWQYDNGKSSRRSYHNKEWADKMEEIGLMPSNTGSPGGKKTGQGMTHYIIPGGLFEKAFDSLVEKQIKYVPTSSESTGTNTKTDKKEKAGSKALKTKYSCPCGNNVWGKPDLAIICADCEQHFEQTS